MYPRRTPSLFRSPHSFQRPYSFHFIPAETPAGKENVASRKAFLTLPSAKGYGVVPRNVAIPLKGSTITTLAVLISLVFISTISIAFIGANVDEPYFRLLLDNAAKISPGIVLLGENVDVDVDEPSVTIRWSIAACGPGFVLSDSPSVHGSKSCGLPAEPLYIYVDGSQEPAATYDPSRIPFDVNTGSRRSVQNLVQFDSSHIFDVHTARVYPFDHYTLSTTVCALSFSNRTLPLRRLVVISTTSSFDIETVDTESHSAFANNTQNTSRDMDLRIKRPCVARALTLLLFVGAWILAHLTVGLVIIARRLAEVRSILKYLFAASIIFVAIPQIRNSMPDAPGLDGVLIDCIGIFPQMVLTGFSVIALLLIAISRELDNTRLGRVHYTPTFNPDLRPLPQPTPIDNSQVDMYRLSKHFHDQYVYPPALGSHRMCHGHHHCRSKTMTRTMEAGEMSDSID